MKVSCILLCLIILFTNCVEAHPGRTDSNGCHFCRTNCDSYGLGYGEYHCHNGNAGNTKEKSDSTFELIVYISIILSIIIFYKKVRHDEEINEIKKYYWRNKQRINGKRNPYTKTIVKNVDDYVKYKLEYNKRHKKR